MQVHVFYQFGNAGCMASFNTMYFLFQLYSAKYPRLVNLPCGGDTSPLYRNNIVEFSSIVDKW